MSATKKKTAKDEDAPQRLPVIGIIVALLILVGGIVLVFVLYKQYQKKSQEDSTPKKPSDTKPPPVIVVTPPKNPKQPVETPKEPVEQPKTPTNPNPTKELPDPTIVGAYPWVGQNYDMHIFYTESTNDKYQLQTSWVAHEQNDPHPTIVLKFVVNDTYIDWNDILSFTGGTKHIYLHGGPKQALVDLINNQTGYGARSWKAVTDYRDINGKSFEFDLDTHETEEEGVTPRINLTYLDYTSEQRNPAQPVLDVQTIEFRATI